MVHPAKPRVTKNKSSGPRQPVVWLPFIFPSAVTRAAAHPPDTLHRGGVPPPIRTSPRAYACPLQMEELARSTPAAMYSPGGGVPNSLHVWRTVVSWVGFLLRILLQILRGTPSWAQLFSFIPFLSSSSSSSPAFRPLPVEAPADTPPPPHTVSDSPSDKLTVLLRSCISSHFDVNIPAFLFSSPHFDVKISPFLFSSPEWIGILVQ